jgi:hypothetical protein
MISISSGTASALGKMFAVQWWKDALRGLALSAVVFATGAILVGCGSAPNVLTTPDNPVSVAKYFPSSLLAEPIHLRAEYTHLTHPFAIKSPRERWTVSLGFVRSDDKLTFRQRQDGGTDRCWTESPGESMRPNTCKITTPGYALRWELLGSDGQIVAEHAYDSLSQREGGTYSPTAITRTLSGFTNQDAGQYRLRVTVLRDAKELDFLKPHILIDTPFFRRD